MYLVRDKFKAKPSKSKQLVEIVRSTSAHFKTNGISNIRVLTDVASTFWTVVWEFEVEEINDYFEMARNVDSNSDVYDSLEGYKEHVIEGNREIFRIEK
ncbi:MAG: hypothetical protein ACJA2S_003964 [Cyclobacteriaceae bacterium]|jgi:hypothetical protein